MVFERGSDRRSSGGKKARKSNMTPMLKSSFKTPGSKSCKKVTISAAETPLNVKHSKTPVTPYPGKRGQAKETATSLALKFGDDGSDDRSDDYSVSDFSNDDGEKDMEKEVAIFTGSNKGIRPRKLAKNKIGNGKGSKKNMSAAAKFEKIFNEMEEESDGEFDGEDGDGNGVDESDGMEGEQDSEMDEEEEEPPVPTRPTKKLAKKGPEAKKDGRGKMPVSVMHSNDVIENMQLLRSSGDSENDYTDEEIEQLEMKKAGDIKSASKKLGNAKGAGKGFAFGEWNTVVSESDDGDHDDDNFLIQDDDEQESTGDEDDEEENEKVVHPPPHSKKVAISAVSSIKKIKAVAHEGKKTVKQSKMQKAGLAASVETVKLGKRKSIDPIATPLKQLKIDPDTVGNEERIRMADRDARRLYVQGFPKKISTADIKAFHPDIVGVHRGQNRTHAFLEFPTESHCEKAYKAIAAIKKFGHPLTVDFCGSKSGTMKSGEIKSTAKDQSSLGVINPLELFVSGIPEKISKQQMKDIFPNAVKTTFADPMGNLGNSFCFVKFDSEANAKAAFEKGANLKIGGKPVIVLYARPRGGIVDEKNENVVVGNKENLRDEAADGSNKKKKQKRSKGEKKAPITKQGSGPGQADYSISSSKEVIDSDEEQDSELIFLPKEKSQKKKGKGGVARKLLMEVDDSEDDENGQFLRIEDEEEPRDMDDSDQDEDNDGDNDDEQEDDSEEDEEEEDDDEDEEVDNDQ